MNIASINIKKIVGFSVPQLSLKNCDQASKNQPCGQSLPSIATVLSKLYRAMKKASGKADLSIYSYSVVVFG